MMKRTAKGKIKNVNPPESVFNTLKKANVRTARALSAARAVEKASKDFLYFVTSGIHGDQRDIDPESPTFGDFKGNDNGDFFRWAGTLLKKRPEDNLLVFETWIGCPVHLNHDENFSFGNVIGSYPQPNLEEKSIDFLNRISRASKPDIVAGIESGAITDTSMGCVVTHSYCGICANYAETEQQWCNHLRYCKGQRLGGPRGKWVYEDNRGIIGLEDSVITFGVGADPLAKIDFSVFKGLNG